ncbi:hypothetical protein O8R26_005298 [Pseudomonas aeruginosa]|nr:hypothetical protein [Pseudomonas aeruginosa]
MAVVLAAIKEGIAIGVVLGRRIEPAALAVARGSVALVRESEINQKGKARKLWDIEEGKGI